MTSTPNAAQLDLKGTTFWASGPEREAAEFLRCAYGEKVGGELSWQYAQGRISNIDSFVKVSVSGTGGQSSSLKLIGEFDLVQLNGGVDVQRFPEKVNPSGEFDSDTNALYRRPLLCPMEGDVEVRDGAMGTPPPEFPRYLTQAMNSLSCDGNTYALPVGVHRLNTLLFSKRLVQELRGRVDPTTDLGVILERIGSYSECSGLSECKRVDPTRRPFQSPREFHQFLADVRELMPPNGSGSPVPPMVIGKGDDFSLLFFAFEFLMASSPKRLFESLWYGINKSTFSGGRPEGSGGATASTGGSCGTGGAQSGGTAGEAGSSNAGTGGVPSSTGAGGSSDLPGRVDAWIEELGSYFVACEDCDCPCGSALVGAPDEFSPPPVEFHGCAVDGGAAGAPGVCSSSSSSKTRDWRAAVAMVARGQALVTPMGDFGVAYANWLDTKCQEVESDPILVIPFPPAGPSEPEVFVYTVDSFALPRSEQGTGYASRRFATEVLGDEDVLFQFAHRKAAIPPLSDAALVWDNLSLSHQREGYAKFSVGKEAPDEANNDGVRLLLGLSGLMPPPEAVKPGSPSSSDLDANDLGRLLEKLRLSQFEAMVDKGALRCDRARPKDRSAASDVKAILGSLPTPAVKHCR